MNISYCVYMAAYRGRDNPQSVQLIGQELSASALTVPLPALAIVLDGPKPSTPYGKEPGGAVGTVGHRLPLLGKDERSCIAC